MFKVLVCENFTNNRKCNFFLNSEQWEEFNKIQDPQYRVFNLPNIIKIPDTIINTLSFLVIINILELP